MTFRRARFICSVCDFVTSELLDFKAHVSAHDHGALSVVERRLAVTPLPPDWHPTRSREIL